MKAVMTDDRAIEEFFQHTCRLPGPLDFREVYELKPMTNINVNRGSKST